MCAWPRPAVSVLPATDDRAPPPPLTRAPPDPVRTGVAVLVGTVVALYAAGLVRTGGTFAYPLDDPAIHLAVARRLAYDGTWGVVAGHYQAASSSPLWTLILAPTQWVVRGAMGEQVPLLLNLAAGVWVIALLRDDLAALVEGDEAGRPAARLAGAAAVVGLVVVVLYLPGLVMVGMEHTFHMALVLATTLAVEARWARPDGREGRWARAGPFVLVAVAAATRGETTFVALALAVALLAVEVRGWHDTERPPASRRSRLLAGAGLGASAAGALAAFGVVNLAYGQEILPNSVILKTLGDRGDTRRSLGAALDRLGSDQLLVALLLVTMVVLVVAACRPGAAGGRLAPAAFPALVLVPAVALQAELGALDGALRYQAYLYGLGVLTVLRALPAARAALAARWSWVPAAALVLLLAPVATHQVRATLGEPGDAEVTWEQRYQVARFLAGAYPHDPIAIGELGYNALYHDGPLTDVYGLGDHEVMTATMEGRKDADFWSAMARRRGFRVVATYAFTLPDAPAGWYPVADWRSPDAYFTTTRFWATDPAAVDPLMAALRAYQPRLPSGVEVTYNDLAPMAARRAEQAAGK